MSKPYNVLIEKEYYKLKNYKVNIALLMMVKNENKRIKVSLNSVIGHVDCLIIHDTGSEDNTIDIIKNHCEEHKINLYLCQGEFVDFSVSRNVSLDYADTIDNVNYLILLDTNDELRGGDNLRKFAEEYKDKKSTGFLVSQEWWSGKCDKYFNLRFVKSREGWRYRGSVHEWMKNTKYKNEEDAPPIHRILENIVLFQDRTQDDNKSGKRFNRDKVLLLADHKNDPTDARTLFYLAQTCSCLNHLEDSLFYYKLRLELEGFQEEKFHSFLRAGEVSELLNHPWYESMTWYIKAFEHSQRVEPLIKIVKYYQEKQNWLIAYTFSNLACSLIYPEYCILFVDKNTYDYTRWHQMGIIAYYVSHYNQGKEACKKAIDTGINNELDNNNLKFYLDKEKSLVTTISKKEFVNLHSKRLKSENPNLTSKKILLQVNRLWKIQK
jgi:hypothetical protein